MNLIKKVIAVLCVVFLLPVNAVFIAKSEDETGNAFRIYLDDIDYNIDSSERTITIPVNVENNSGFSSLQLLFEFDSRLKYKSTKNEILSDIIKESSDSKLAVLYASGNTEKRNGVLFDIEFELPSDLKAGDKFVINPKISLLSDDNGNDIKYAVGGCSVNVFSDKEETTQKNTPKVYIENIKTEYSEKIAVPVKISESIEAASVGISLKTDSSLEYLGFESNIRASNVTYKSGNIGFTAADSNNFEISGDIFTLYFKVPESLEEKMYTFEIKYAEFYDKNGISSEAELGSGTLTVSAKKETETTQISTTTVTTTINTTIITTANTTAKTTTKATTTNTTNTTNTQKTTSTSVTTSTTLNTVTSATYPTTATEKTEVTSSTSESGVATTAQTTETNTTETSEKAVISLENIKTDKGQKGDIIKIPVNIKNNIGFASTGFRVIYPDNMKLTDVEGGIIEAPAFYVKGSTAAITSSSEKNLISDGVLFTLCFTLERNISTGEEANVSIQKLIFSNLDEKNIETETKNSSVTFEIKPTIEPTTEKITETTEKQDTNDYLGDVNRDKNIDSKDAVLVLVDYAKSMTGIKSDIPLEYADVNSDGRIDSKDAVYILTYYAKKMVSPDIVSMREYMKEYA